MKETAPDIQIPDMIISRIIYAAQCVREKDSYDVYMKQYSPITNL